MTGKIPYYWVNPKNGRAYWKPNKRMIDYGWQSVALGEAGPEAEKQAKLWTARYHEEREEDPSALGLRRASRPPRIDDLQFVYFLQVKDQIKIGTSKVPFLRLQAIAASLSGRVMRAVLVSGTTRDEKRLHDRFKSYRLGGEWFTASSPIILTMGRCAMAGVVVHDGENEPATSAPESRSGRGERVKAEKLSA